MQKASVKTLNYLCGLFGLVPRWKNQNKGGVTERQPLGISEAWTLCSLSGGHTQDVTEQIQRYMGYLLKNGGKDTGARSFWNQCESNVFIDH